MDPFDTLGLEPTFELDRQLLERRYRDLQKALHPDKHVGATAAARRASLSKAVDVNEAYRVLKNDVKRAEALVRRLGGTVTEDGKAADPAFLMEVMELREELSAAKENQDMDAVAKLGQRADQEIRASSEQLARSLKDAAAGDAAALERASQVLGRVRYFRRLRDEVEAIEEQALA